jgi:hypothetical protein
MGLFDYVLAPLNCPYCKNEEKSHAWQTKALGCNLKTYKVDDVLKLEDSEKMLIVEEGFFEIHTICEKCQKYISASIKIKNQKITNEIVYKKEL